MKPSAWRAIGFVWEVLMDIAVPTVVFALLGRWLDRTWHFAFLFTLILFIPALALSFVLILRRARELQREQKQEMADEKRV